MGLGKDLSKSFGKPLQSPRCVPDSYFSLRPVPELYPRQEAWIVMAAVCE